MAQNPTVWSSTSSYCGQTESVLGISYLLNMWEMDIGLAFSFCCHSVCFGETQHLLTELHKKLINVSDIYDYCVNMLCRNVAFLCSSLDIESYHLKQLLSYEPIKNEFVQETRLLGEAQRAFCFSFVHRNGPWTCLFHSLLLCSDVQHHDNHHHYNVDVGYEIVKSITI